MQDLSTGEMRDLTPFLKEIPKAQDNETLFQLQKRLDEACKAAEPNPRKRGPVFELGEVIELRGGRFQITKLEPGRMVLRGVPSL